jgi:hypothetical protein
MSPANEVRYSERDTQTAAPSYPRGEPGHLHGPEYSPQGQTGRGGVFYQEDPRAKSPALAMVLSLMPGLGQVYLGFYQQGFVNILVVASIIAALAHGVPGYLEPLLGVFLAFFWLYNLVDAGRRASFYNQALAGLGPLEMPGGLKMYESGGSIAGGAALIAVGLLFFAHTRFGMSLEWLDQWWPVALVLMGAYLLYRAYREHKKESQVPTGTGTA